MDERMRGLPRGIEVLTAWTESNHDPDLMGRQIRTTVEEGIEAEVDMTLGLAKLASILLVQLTVASGRTERELLQEIAIRYTT